MAAVSIYHLYPEHLNLYGDRGNLIALCRRAQWHGIETAVIPVGPGENINFAGCDLLFMGGGQDSDQKRVAADLKLRRGEMCRAIEEGMVIFAVCGSYQLMGSYYTTASGERLGGLEILDLYSEAGKKRLIGNAVIESDLWEPPRTLVGFENHGGRTFLGPDLKPLGRVLQGYGNNGRDRTEGAVYKNVIGTYLHGSLLPKNPWLTDYLLKKTLAYRGLACKLQDLDDSLEKQAHRAAIKLARSRRYKLRSPGF